DEAGRSAIQHSDTTGRIGVVEFCGDRRGTGFRIGEGDFVVVAGHFDVVLHPHIRSGCGPGRVVLDLHVVTAGVDNKVTRGDLVDGAGAVFVQAIRFGTPAVVILVDVSACIVVDLYFEPGKHGAPRGIGAYWRTLGVSTLP